MLDLNYTPVVPQEKERENEYDHTEEKKKPSIHGYLKLLFVLSFLR